MGGWAFAFHVVAFVIVAAGVLAEKGPWVMLGAIFAACAIVGLVNYHRFVRQMELRAGTVSPKASGPAPASPTPRAPDRRS